MTPLPAADRWFERTRIDDATTLEREVAMLERAGYDVHEPLFVTAQPTGFAVGSFRQQPPTLRPLTSRAP